MDLDALPERIARRLYPVANGCLRATGSHNANGYATVTWKGRNWLLHRVVWTILVGPIADGMTIDHVRDRGCVFKDCQLLEHLELVTNTENMRRSRGESGRGSYERAKTHCPHGHPYDDTNTYWYHGRRMCRACRAARVTASRQPKEG